jgi:hypothetical protein
MNDIVRMLENRAKWQRQRAYLSWPEKIRMAESMRDALRRLRSGTSHRQSPDIVEEYPQPEKK